MGERLEHPPGVVLLDDRERPAGAGRGRVEASLGGLEGRQAGVGQREREPVAGPLGDRDGPHRGFAACVEVAERAEDAAEVGR